MGRSVRHLDTATCGRCHPQGLQNRLSSGAGGDGPDELVLAHGRPAGDPQAFRHFVEFGPGHRAEIPRRRGRPSLGWSWGWGRGRSGIPVTGTVAGREAIPPAPRPQGPCQHRRKRDGDGNQDPHAHPSGGTFPQGSSGPSWRETQPATRTGSAAPQAPQKRASSRLNSWHRSHSCPAEPCWPQWVQK